MARPVAVITETLDEVCAAWLGERMEVRRMPPEDRPGLLRALKGVTALIVRTYTRVDPELLAAAPDLRVVARAGVGLDNVDVAACRARGVEVVYSPDANTQAVVEYLFHLLLARFRPTYWLDGAVTPARWNELREEIVGERQLSEITLGILGLGRVGSQVSKVAMALGMRVMGYDILGEESARRRCAGSLHWAEPQALFSGSDVLTIHVDGRPENRGLVSAERLSWMRPEALLVNTARGMLVDAAALADWAIVNGRHGAMAILDVHDPEPFGEDYPLLGLPNVMLAPHLASRTRTALRNMSWVVRDVWAVLEGRPPEFPAP